MATFLVTGGAGFIGSNLVEALLERGETVRVLDDLSTGKRANFEGFADRITFFEGSITDEAVCRRAVAGVDFVLHLAALPSVPRSVEDPVGTNEVNVNGTLNMLVASRDAGVKRFVFAASSAAYGDNPVSPKREDMLVSPLSPYAVQKITGELYCRMFYSLYGLETIALRYFNVFGPRQDPNSQYAAVVPRFITMFLRNEAPVIDGDGEQSRDFTFVANVIHANLLACEAPSAAAGQVFNIACGERISVNELARQVRAQVGAQVEAEHGPARIGDVKHSLADIDKARGLLGFEPVALFDDGMKRVVAWYKARAQA